VIRDVPPEQTPVPVIAKRTRGKAGELFAEQQEPDEATPAATGAWPTIVATGAWPTIVEIPRWLARIERSLASGESPSPAAAEFAASLAGVGDQGVACEDSAAPEASLSFEVASRESTSPPASGPNEAAPPAPPDSQGPERQTRLF
jgi:hypothetical protein